MKAIESPSPTLRTKAGWCTRYALACGYVEQSYGPGGSVTLWQEHGVLHVRQIAPDGSRVRWDHPKTLRAARTLFRSISQSIA